MKNLFVILSLILSVTCFAQGGGDRVGSGDISLPILAVHFPSNPLLEVPRIRTVEIYGNGRVVETIVTNRGSEAEELSFRLVSVLSPKKLERAISCSAEFSSQNFQSKPDEYCMDDSGVHYKGEFGEKTFAVRYCGQLQSLDTSCSRAMVKLLDNLSR